MSTTTLDTRMRRTPIDPTTWGLAFQMHQAELTEGSTRTLRCSGQVDLIEDPSAPLGLSCGHPDDMRGQFAAVLTQLDALLAAAEMTRADIVHVRFFATDVAAALEHYDVYAAWIGEAEVMPPQSLIGVAALVDASLLIEIEMTAAA